MSHMKTKKHAHLRAKMPEWLATTLSALLIALLIVAYFLFFRPNVAVSLQPASNDSAHDRALSFTHPLTIGDAHLSVALALTGAQQEQGLSGTTALASDQGMLFVFTTDSIVPFWMKDMNYPLDIIWISADKQVADISPNLSPATYPNSFSPKLPVRYALEVPAGFTKAEGIVVGTQVSF